MSLEKIICVHPRNLREINTMNNLCVKNYFWFFVNLGDKNNAYKFPKHFSANILVSNIRSYKCM